VERPSPRALTHPSPTGDDPRPVSPLPVQDFQPSHASQQGTGKRRSGHPPSRSGLYTDRNVPRPPGVEVPTPPLRYLGADTCGWPSGRDLASSGWWPTDRAPDRTSAVEETPGRERGRLPRTCGAVVSPGEQRGETGFVGGDGGNRESCDLAPQASGRHKRGKYSE